MAHVSNVQGAAGSFVPMATLFVDTISAAMDGFRTLSLNPVPALIRIQARVSERRHLATLDDRLLADIGLDRADAMAEADKPFWRA